MDKRYQVFISSTYADLKDERKNIMQTIMEMDCIPAGMELFPATDEEQWEFIKKIIDDCDYYLLIIGGRYGSITPDGISYTEKEFDYAVEKGIKVIALIHGKPDTISVDKSELDPTVREKLNQFRKKVATDRLVKFYKNPDELPGLISLSLTKMIKAYPATGWIRADQVSNPELLFDINQLRKENKELQDKLMKSEKDQQQTFDDIADFNSGFKFDYSYTYSNGEYLHTGTSNFEIAWDTLFSLISPRLHGFCSDKELKNMIDTIFIKRIPIVTNNFSIDDEDFITMTIQFIGYNLLQREYKKTENGQEEVFWRLTEKGEQAMIETRIIKKNQKY